MKWNGFVLTGSVRNDWVDQEIRSTFNFPNLPVPTLNRTTIDQQRFSALSYRVGLGYEFDFGLVPYASYPPRSTRRSPAPSRSSTRRPMPGRGRNRRSRRPARPSGRSTISSRWRTRRGPASVPSQSILTRITRGP
ncbi:hypothetical protein [Methylobacterium dankookense]|uniref:hypothetical protein n=1 Tax=Methylobacterium dankookense TaxID=560405 RepID=UPI001EDE188F|nr:hypothetical protein [Methylobacterium dankookense]